jgi:hypothetical protein
VNARQAPGSDHQQLVELHYSRVLVLIASAVFASAVGFTAFWVLIGLVSERSLALVVGLLALAIGFPMLIAFAPPLVRAWTRKGAVVVLSADGVADARKKVTFIPWSDIGQVSLGVGNNAHFLCFEFRKADRERQDASGLGWLGTLLSRARSLGDWNVSLRLLACRKREILKVAQRMHQQSVRRQVVALNEGRANGWSGSL